MSDTTKRALEMSLKNLLLKKPVNKITINDISQDCGVNRATFYYHFKDIYDLIEWSCEEDSRKAAAGNTTYETWEQGFLNIFHAVEENKPFILNVYHHVSQDQIIRYLYRVVYQLIIDVVDECAEGMSVREEDRKFIADFYKYAFVGILLDWIRQDMNPSPERIVEKLSDMIDGDMVRMLEKCRTDGLSV
jgi:probable dihydroxyacetone kinase regulator